MNEKSLNTLIREIKMLIEHKQDKWNNSKIYITVPILFAGWLYMQHVYKEKGEYKVSPSIRINLFKKGYYVYNYIFTKLTKNVILNKANSKYYDEMTKKIIIQINECGANGMFCNYKNIRKIIEADIRKVKYNSDGDLFVPRKKGSMESFLD